MAPGASKWQLHWWPLLLKESEYIFWGNVSVSGWELTCFSSPPRLSIGFYDLWIILIVLATKTDQENIVFNTLLFKRPAHVENSIVEVDRWFVWGYITVDADMEVPKHIQDALGRFLETFRFFKIKPDSCVFQKRHLKRQLMHPGNWRFMLFLCPWICMQTYISKNYEAKWIGRNMWLSSSLFDAAIGYWA